MPPHFSTIAQLSPLDGRYHKSLQPIAQIFSEAGLIHQRLRVEMEWLLALNQYRVLPNEVLCLSTHAEKWIRQRVETFNETDAQSVKTLEAKTNHDVKALEYWLHEQFTASGDTSLQQAIPAIHFACTSEDINNLAVNLQIQQGLEIHLNGLMQHVIETLTTMAKAQANLPVLARTHGQPATPTTLGKEIAVFVNRLQKSWHAVKQIKLSGKLNGAIGGFNAHYVAAPQIDWTRISDQVIQTLGFEPNHYTTQIEPHDRLAALFMALSLHNTIAIDLCRDVWGYIAQDYYKLKIVDDEVGSSTMPHKVNPIDFENAEGNLGLANALFTHMAQKLPVSRFQRDLSDSTVLRNVGVAFGHTVLAWKSLACGLAKLTPHPEKMDTDLELNWEVLTEAIQTVLRYEGHANAYDLIKKATRGQKISHEQYQRLLDDLPLSLEGRIKLQSLRPQQYLGISAWLAKKCES